MSDANRRDLCADDYVTNRKGVFEYLLGGSTDKKLLEVRVFDEKGELKGTGPFIWHREKVELGTWSGEVDGYNGRGRRRVMG